MNSSISRYSAIGTLILFTACITLYFFHDYSYRELQKNFVLGLDGVELVSPDESIHPQFLPWEPLEKNLSLDDMVKKLCVEAKKAENCYQEKEARFRTFRKQHQVERPDGTKYVLERNTVPLSETDITSSLLNQRLQLIADWAKANQKKNALFPYLYEPSTNSYPTGEYVVRQLVFAQGLFATAHALHDSTLLEIASQNESKILSTYTRTDEFGRMYMTDSSGPAPLGDTALAVLMMREHREETPLTQTEKNFGEYLLHAQRPDGSFETFQGMATSTQDEQFSSGQAIAALARLNAVEPQRPYDAAIEKAYKYYRPKIEYDFQPQYAPWHIQAFSVAYRQTHNEAYADYVFWLADGLIETMLNHDSRAQEDEVGRFFNPEYPSWGPPHSASTGVYTEGLAYAYQLASERSNVSRMKKYRTALLLGTRSLLLDQWTPESAYYMTNPERVVGSFKVTITDNRGRIDQIGHASNALPRVLAIISGEAK